MWLFCLVLVVATSSRSGFAFAQNDEAPLPDTFGADGFVFDGPASGPRVTPIDGSSSFGSRSTSSRTRSTTTTTTTTTTTSKPSTDLEMEQCIARCMVTPEYNPVCGSDSVIYDNPGRLSCASTCGKDVTLSYYGRCMTSKVRGG